jgi:hypothetical protein
MLPSSVRDDGPPQRLVARTCGLERAQLVAVQRNLEVSCGGDDAGAAMVGALEACDWGGVPSSRIPLRRPAMNASPAPIGSTAGSARPWTVTGARPSRENHVEATAS